MPIVAFAPAMLTSPAKIFFRDKHTTPMITKTEETTALILAGEGYQLTIAPVAEARKGELLNLSGRIGCVNDNDESARAQHVSRRLAQMRIEVEKCRKEVKEPVNLIGKLIDKTAKDFMLEIEAEEKRITRLVGDHAQEVLWRKEAQIREEQKAFEVARAARAAAEAAELQAADTGKISDIIAAKKADQERAAALALRMDTSAGVAEMKVAEGVRFAWDFEVTDITALLAAYPGLVTLTVRRAEILALIKNQEEVGATTEMPGIRTFKRPVVSSR